MSTGILWIGTVDRSVGRKGGVEGVGPMGRLLYMGGSLAESRGSWEEVDPCDYLLQRKVVLLKKEMV